MRLLVLGPNGQLGSDVRSACERREGFRFVPLGRDRLDVSRPDQIRAALTDLDFDALVNCTSYHKTDEVEHNAGLAFAVNAHAVMAMAQTCEAKKVPFVHISTDYVFRGDAARGYVETDEPGPINVYGASKAMGENLALRAYPHGTFILRVASLYGVAGASGKGGNFVETMIRVGREKGRLRVVNDITMSPTATSDVAQTILSLLARRVEPGVFHVVNAGQATWFEFAQEIVSRAGVKAEVEPIGSHEYPTAALRPTYSVLNNGKLTRTVGPIDHWTEALDRYLIAKGHATRPVTAAR